jgi:hypothetical protein
VDAQTNHTLDWGADAGEEFVYVLQREYYSDQSNMIFMEGQIPFLTDIVPGEKVILAVGTLDPIDDMITLGHTAILTGSMIPHLLWQI